MAANPRRQSLRLTPSTPTATQSNVFSQSSFATAVPPPPSNSTSLTTPTPGSSSSPSHTTSVSTLPTGYTPPPHRASLSANGGGYKTMRTLRSTMDPSLYNPTPETIDANGLPAHLSKNELSTTRSTGKEEISIVRTKEDEDEDNKLREKEKNMSWDDKRKLEDHLFLVREEVLSTEATYVEKLLSLRSAWLEPLTKIDSAVITNEIGITTSQRTTLLSNLAVIIGFQEKFYNDLKTAGPRRVEEVIIQYSHFFRLYSKYATDYQAMAETLTALAPSKKWAAFTTVVDKNLGASSGNELLMSFLIMPIQRIPRYELLLREMKRATLPSAPEFETISRALGLIKQTATHVNAAKKEAENMALLLDIQRKIKGEMAKDLQLVQPHRRHVKTVTVQLTEPSKTSFFGTIKKNVRVMYLFNDVLVWTNVDNEYKSFFNIAAISHLESLDDNQLQVSSSSKFLQIDFCLDKTRPAPDTDKAREIATAKQEWLDNLQQLVEETQLARRRQRSFRQKDDSRVQTHRAIVNKFNTLDKQQMAELQQQMAEEQAAAAANGGDAEPQ